jgi:hypothetical protein
LIRDEIKRGDLFFCYEVDRRLLVGFARAAADGRDAGAGSLLYFCPPSQAVWLEHPLTRHPDLDHVLAFTPHRGRGTIGEIAPDELARIRRIALKRNPAQVASLARIFRQRLRAGKSAAWRSDRPVPDSLAGVRHRSTMYGYLE